MTIITDAERDALRAHMDDTLTETCTIRRVARSEDGQGGWTEGWADEYADVPCRLDPFQAVVSQYDTAAHNARIANVDEYALRVKAAQDILPGDRVVLNGITYEVEGVQDAHTWLAVKRCKLTRIR
jgi:hypothetical protein